MKCKPHSTMFGRCNGSLASFSSSSLMRLSFHCSLLICHVPNAKVTIGYTVNGCEDFPGQLLLHPAHAQLCGTSAHNERQDDSRARHIIARPSGALLLLACECTPAGSWRLCRMSSLPGSLEGSMPHYSRCIEESVRREESWHPRSHGWSSTLFDRPSR